MPEESLMRKVVGEEVLDALRPFMEFVTAQFAIVHENHHALARRVERLELATDVVRADLSAVKADTLSIRADMAVMKSDISDVKYDVRRLDKRVETLEPNHHYA